MKHPQRSKPKQQRSLQWCERHWAPYRADDETGKRPNGIMATLLLVQKFIDSPMVSELTDRSPAALNKIMEEGEPLCCRLGDEVMDGILERSSGIGGMNNRDINKAADLEQRFAAELQALDRSGLDIVLTLTPVQAWILLGQLQLALRHPGNVGQSAALAREIADRVQKGVAPSGALKEVAEQGWNEEHDE